ncbi:MAG: PorP/SprF family type IX secretion system membrane protein [Williamsia sp.]|nr:PorP/SprF family type IX secretion system membrane protein [Williamsia sp.]
MKKAVWMIGCVLMTALLQAQDINFSQFYELPLLRNPGLAGTYDGDLRVTGAFKSQWGSVTTPYVSQALGGEAKFALPHSETDFVSLGLQITNDVAGDSRFGKTQFFPLLAYHKLLDPNNNTFATVGFLVGPVQERFDFSKLTFDDQFVNGAYSSANPTRQTFTGSEFVYFDWSAGVSYSSQAGEGIRYYAGAALFHMSKPRVAFDRNMDVRLNQKLVFNAGLSAATNDYNKIILYADYFTQGAYSQVQGGLMYKHDFIQEGENDGETISLYGGGLLRWNDAFVPVLKFDYYKLGIGLSYDVNLSKLHTASHLRAGPELTLSYRGFLGGNSSSTRQVKCRPQGL